MKLSIFISALLLSSSIFAGVTDVVPKNMKRGDRYVRVTELKKDVVLFESCIKGFENGGCSVIGRSAGYSIDELTSQRNLENAEILGSSLSAAIGIILTAGTGAWIGGSIGASSGYIISGIGTTLVGGAVGTAAGGVLVATVDALNPIEQTQQARVLNSEVIYDRDVEVSDINEYISRLELVLSKI